MTFNSFLAKPTCPDIALYVSLVFLVPFVPCDLRGLLSLYLPHSCLQLKLQKKHLYAHWPPANVPHSSGKWK